MQHRPDNTIWIKTKTDVRRRNKTNLFFFWFAGCGRLRRIGFGKKRRDSGTINSVLENRKVESGGEDETGGKAERIGGGDAMSGEI